MGSETVFILFLPRGETQIVKHCETNSTGMILK